MKNNNKGGGGGKARVRVFLAEIEGDDDTIQEALRSVGAALGKTFQQNITVIKAPPAGGETSSKELGAANLPDTPEGELVDESSDSAEVVPARKASPRAQSQPRKPVSYTFIKDINFRPADKQSLKDFFAEKKPSDQQQVLTVVLYYLYRVLEINNITLDHVYSGLKEAGVRVPPDIASIFRNISNRKNYVDSGDCDCLKTTTTGDNFVEHDLPTKNKKESKGD
jgi:hypothetical protein